MHNILEKEIKLLLPQVNRKQKHGIIITLVSSFIALAYEGIYNALLKAVNAMNNKANIQCNKLIKLDDTMLINGIYNAETLEKLIKTVHWIHNTTSSHEKLFAGKHNHSVFRILYAHSLGLQHYSTNSLLYLRIIQNKYISLYRELITQLHTYVSAIRVPVKGYLPNTLVKPAKLQEILSCYVWQWCVILKVVLGYRVLHIVAYIGALQYTMLVFRFPSLCTLWQYIKIKCNFCIQSIQLFIITICSHYYNTMHRYINTHLSV